MLEINKIHQGDCLEELKELEENSVDAIVTDPPYGIGFMGKEWDVFKQENIQKITKNSHNRKKTVIRSTTGKPETVNRGWNSEAAAAGLYDRSEKGIRGYQNWCYEWAKECLRVLKPGGHLIASNSSRMYHRMASGIEDAGFEIRDTIMWLYGSGFPKSLNIGKQIDKINGRELEEYYNLGKHIKEQRINKNKKKEELNKLLNAKLKIEHYESFNSPSFFSIPTPEDYKILKKELNLNNKFDYLIDRIGAEREVIGKKKTNLTVMQNIGKDNISGEINITTPATQEAKQWEGWGTALKPAHEPIVVARKPLSEKNVALNVLKWGTGGINIDDCRIGVEVRINKGMSKKQPELAGTFRDDNWIPKDVENIAQGRFPANIILDEEAGKMLDEQSGEISPSFRKGNRDSRLAMFDFGSQDKTNQGFNDKGGASRFFYCAKASKSERNYGCEVEKEKNKRPVGEAFGEGNAITSQSESKGNNHPTVKPLALMEYLIKLVSKKGSVVLDPFLGSGTTLIACAKLGRKGIGIEKEEEYIKIAKARIKPYLSQKTLNEIGTKTYL